MLLIEALEGRRLFAGTAKFLGKLVGAEEVPPHLTPARGVVKFKLSRDGSAMSYRITARKIDNVVGAHIHVAARGVNGAIAVDLMEPAGMKVGKHKFSVRGTITAAELTGTLAGLTMADLVAQMTAGTTYVNVHTSDGVEPADTGAGDFPNGEIRGQLRRLGKRFNTAPLDETPTVPGY